MFNFFVNTVTGDIFNTSIIKLSYKPPVLCFIFMRELLAGRLTTGTIETPPWRTFVKVNAVLIAQFGLLLHIDNSFAHEKMSEFDSSFKGMGYKYGDPKVQVKTECVNATIHALM